MKLALLFLIIAPVLLAKCQAQNECESPWKKVNDNICLFLTSIPKPWHHAKFLCNFYGGDLLYVENQTEQDLIQDYLSRLIKYRFNKKSFVWLDLIDRSNDEDWIWSRNNESITYNNWMNKNTIRTYDDDSRELNCACLKLKDGSWKDCDCSLSQHFVCRKSDQTINLDILMPVTTTTTTTTTTTSTTTSTTSTRASIEEENSALFNFDDDTTTVPVTTEEEDSLNEDYDSMHKQKNLILDEFEDKRMIMFKKILLDEKDKEKEDILKKLENNGKTQNGTLEMDVKLSGDGRELTKMLKGTKKKTYINGFVGDVSKSAKYSTNTLRIVIDKNLSSFKSYFCPFGFGHYLNYMSGCSKYSVCEDWDADYAVFSQYECSYNKIFSMNSLKCMPLFKSKCDENSPIFMPF